MSDPLSYMDSVEEKIQPTKEELENLRQQTLELKEKLEPFYNLYQSDDWKKVEKSLKDDVYANVHIHPADPKNMYFVNTAWGMKRCLERIEEYSEKYTECLKKLSRGEV